MARPLVYYCPHCWATVPARAELCPACGAIIEDPGADIVAKYAAALRHPQPETRLRAAWLLGRMRAVRAVPELLAVIAGRGRDPYLLSAAARSLGQIGDRQAVPGLIALLRDPPVSYMVRVEAVKALAALGGEDARRTLAEAAARDSNDRVREAASQALARKDDAAA